MHNSERPEDEERHHVHSIENPFDEADEGDETRCVSGYHKQNGAYRLYFMVFRIILFCHSVIPC